MVNAKELRLLMAGLTCGDCLGSSSEFADAAGVVHAYKKYSPRGWPFRQVGGGPFNWRPGQGTDDTDTAMALVRAAVSPGGFSGESAAKALADWYRSGPRDIGGTTAAALRNCAAGVPWYQSGMARWKQSPGNSANGSLMRNGVVCGLVDPAITDFTEALAEAFRLTTTHAIITHYDPLSVLCCAVQTWLLASLLWSEDGAEPFQQHTADEVPNWLDEAIELFLTWLDGQTEPGIVFWRDTVSATVAEAVKTLRAADFSPEWDAFSAVGSGPGQGYSVLCLQTAVWATNWAVMDEPYPHVPSHLPAEPFQRTGADVLGWVALLGGDADTNGAVAGAAVAAALGSIPPHLTDGLEAMQELERVLAAHEP